MHFCLSFEVQYLRLDAFSNLSDFFRRFHFHGLKSLEKFPLEKILPFLPGSPPAAAAAAEEAETTSP